MLICIEFLCTFNIIILACSHKTFQNIYNSQIDRALKYFQTRKTKKIKQNKHGYGNSSWRRLKELNIHRTDRQTTSQQNSHTSDITAYICKFQCNEGTGKGMHECMC